MTINVREIVTQARERLADSDGRRWNDTRMLYLMNDALLDMSLRTRLFLTTGWSAVESGKANYNLESNILKLDRVSYKRANEQSSYNLPFFNHSQLDEGHITDENYLHGSYSGYTYEYERLTGDGWDEDKSTDPRVVLVSKQQPGQFRLYPIPDFETMPSTTSATQAQQEARHGIITSVPSLAGNPLDTISILNPFGTVTSTLPDKYLIITYIAKLQAETLSATFDYDTQLRRPLENYIVAKAIREQKDTYDPERAGRETAYYEKSLKELEDQRAKDFRSARSTRITPRWYG